jgi:hypothetical protein
VRLLSVIDQISRAQLLEPVLLALVGIPPNKPLSRGFKDFGMLLSPAQTTELLVRVARGGGLVNLLDQLAPPPGGMSDDALDAAWRMTRLFAEGYWPDDPWFGSARRMYTSLVRSLVRSGTRFRPWARLLAHLIAIYGVYLDSFTPEQLAQYRTRVLQIEQHVALTGRLPI